VPRDCCTKSEKSRMRTGLHRPLYSTAGVAAPRTRKAEYGNTMPFQAAYSGEPAERPSERIHARLCQLSFGTGTLLRCQMHTCSPDGKQRVASSRRVQCCAMQCMCEKCSGKQITGKADTACKQGERGRRPTGKGLSCKAGMRTEGKNPLLRTNLVTRLDKTTLYGNASVKVGRPSDTLGTAVPSCHKQRPRLPGPWTI
jgi:hypothetical protein